jgi:hypothetical protein
MKVPTSNIQHPEKLQASSFERGCGPALFGALSLEFLWSLELGAWSLLQP